MRVLLGPLLTLPLLAWAGPHASAQTGQSADFRSDTALVRVDAQVAGEGRTIADLSKDDFQLSDNGKPQQIRYFSHDEGPLDLVLLFDVSGSMTPKLKAVGDAMRIAMEQLHPGDRVAVMVFAYEPQMLLPLTGELRAVETVVQSDVVGGKSGGGTRLLAAVDQAAVTLLQDKASGRRRAILAFTDNAGMVSGKPADVVRRLWQADATLSALVFRAGPPATQPNQAAPSSRGTTPKLLTAEHLTGVCEQTGGEMVDAENAAAAFPEVVRRLRQRYSLFYSMPAGKPGEERRVKVELAKTAQRKYPSARIWARKGYLIP